MLNNISTYDLNKIKNFKNGDLKKIEGKQINNILNHKIDWKGFN